MLMQRQMKTAQELGISQEQLDALVMTRDHLNKMQLKENLWVRFIKNQPVVFRMNTWITGFVYEERCGSVCCIGGTAELLGNVNFTDRHIPLPEQLDNLFFPPKGQKHYQVSIHASRHPAWKATPKQAAVALETYLYDGKTDWDFAMAA